MAESELRSASSLRWEASSWTRSSSIRSANSNASSSSSCLIDFGVCSLAGVAGLSKGLAEGLRMIAGEAAGLLILTGGEILGGT